jgi:beta-lactamase class A
MRWSERAGWKRSSGSYSYIPEEYRHVDTRRNWLWFGVRMVVITAMIVLLGEHFTSSKTIAPQVATAAAHTPAQSVAEQPPASPAAQPVDLSPQLQTLFASWAAQNKNANWGIALHQLSGGSADASYQPGQAFYPASIYKLLILQTLFQKIPYTSWGRPLSGGVSFSACVNKMIRYSDNTCGIALGKYTGWTAVTNQLKTLGLINTALNTGDSQLHTTAGDLSRYLQYFYQDNTYPDAKQFVMNVMSAQIFRAGIPTGSPGCTVYDKIGDLNGYKHDAAIVVCPSTTYILVVTSKGGSYAQIADIARQVNSLLVAP